MNERGPYEEAIDRALGGDMFTRRQYMIRKLIHKGIQFPTAVDAVNGAAKVHRKWNMDEQRTWAEWEAVLAKGREKEESE